MLTGNLQFHSINMHLKENYKSTIESFPGD